MMKGWMAKVTAAALTAAAMPPVAARAQRTPAPPAPLSGDSAVKQGADAWETGNYARALALWRPLAARGDADAQYNLAQAYRLGRGVTVDEKAARDWYLKAAQSGHREAQANYGLMLFQSGDRRGALPWLDKAAVRGDARAQYVVGTALFNGDVAGKDWTRAYALMSRAAAAGLPQARTSLAEMDRFVPLNQRQQGTALARDMERSERLAQAETAPAGTLVRASAPAASPVPADEAVARAVETAPPVPAASGRNRRLARTEAARAAAARTPAQQPQPVQAAAPAASASGGGWRVQVGAFSTEAAASAAWAGIERKVPGLVLRPFYTKASAVTRLQAGPLASKAAATQACARIAAAGAPCFPVGGQ